MTETPVLSVKTLFAEKDAIETRRRAEAEAAARSHQEEMAAFSKRVMDYHITEEDKARTIARIRKAFDAGEKELVLIKFPSTLCEDSGRRINNHLEGWQDTLPGVFHKIYLWWEKELKPGGFTFSARILDFPGGMPGDVGRVIGGPDRPDTA